MPNSHRIGVDEACSLNGVTFDEAIEQAVNDGTAIALCDEGCQTEPDGFCQHNCPSILVAMSMI